MAGPHAAHKGKTGQPHQQRHWRHPQYIGETQPLVKVSCTQKDGGQFTVYATGAPVGFADRAKVEAVLDGAKAGRYGVRDLVRGLVTSELFLNK